MSEFHDLYTRYARDVHRFALYLSCDPALADDITSEAFLRAWSSGAPIDRRRWRAFCARCAGFRKSIGPRC
jgi:DNA-directed RNA polymerase specialized sigma24 family protein